MAKKYASSSYRTHEFEARQLESPSKLLSGLDNLNISQFIITVKCQAAVMFDFIRGHIPSLLVSVVDPLATCSLSYSSSLGK
jgi:hypothetical protein